MSAIVWIYFRCGIAPAEKERERDGRDSRTRSHPSSCYVTQQIHSAILLMLHVRGTDVAFPVCVSDLPAAYYDLPPKTRGACAIILTNAIFSSKDGRLHPRRRRAARYSRRKLAYAAEQGQRTEQRCRAPQWRSREENYRKSTTCVRRSFLAVTRVNDSSARVVPPAEGF